MAKQASVVSSQELHAFGNFLTKSKEDLQSLFVMVSREISRINGEWDDQEFIKFRDAYNEDINHVAHLLNLLADHSRFVHLKADAIENYNSIR